MGFEEWYGPGDDTPAMAFVARSFAEGWKEVTISSKGKNFDDDPDPAHLFRFTFASGGRLCGYRPIPIGE